MKEDAPSHESTSRRQFTKAIVTAAVAAPLAATACRQKTPQRSTKPVPAEARGFAAELGPGIEDHIPPMGLTDGSLVLDLHDSFDPVDGEPLSGGRWLYKLPSFGNINKVMVTVSNEMDLYNAYYAYIGRPFCDPQTVTIKLWLEQKRSASNDYEGVDTTKPPEVIITSPGMLQMEINEKLGRRARSKHPYRPWKYEHEGNGYARHFRIGVLEISSTTCPTARWVSRNFDHYRIWIFGPDIDH